MPTSPTDSVAPAVGETDEREHSDVFQRLPEEARAKVRAAWQKERDDEARWHQRRRQSLSRTVLECASLLALLVILSRAFGWRTLATSVLLTGPALGWLIDRMQPDRAGVALCGVLGYLTTTALAGFFPTQDLFGMVFAGTVFGVYGVRREFRSSVGEA